MTRHQRRKAKVARDQAKLLSLVEAARAERNAAIIARNVGQLRNGVRFETSGALAPRAYRFEGASSESARVASNIVTAKSYDANDREISRLKGTKA